MGDSEDRQQPSGPTQRLRLAFAGALTVALAVALSAALAAGGSGSGQREFDPAPQRCVEEWNDDPHIVNLGRHQYAAHGYVRAQVLTLASDFEAPVPAEDPNARCVVAFASPTLDPEVSAAGLARRGGRWVPLSLVQSLDRLTEMQFAAQSAYNAELDDAGRLRALEP